MANIIHVVILCQKQFDFQNIGKLQFYFKTKINQPNNYFRKP
jgi:hypothetical protein